MAKVTGVLTKIGMKSGTTNGRAWTAYSIQVESAGQPAWYRLGFTAPTVKEGSFVSFETKEDKPGLFSVVGEISVEKGAPAAAAIANNTFLADNRQNSIVRQNATTTAARIVSDMITHGVIKLPAKGANFDLYMDYVTTIADQVFLQNIHPATAGELEEKAGGDGGGGVAESADYWGDAEKAA